jgi:hypothetical protein
VFIATDMFPSCSPEVIEDWFLELKTQANLSNDPTQLICIKETANEVYSRCKKANYTEKFISTAYNNVMTTATEKLQRLKYGKIAPVTKKDDSHLLTFSTGRGSHSAVDSFEKNFKKKNNLQNLWI